MLSQSKFYAPHKSRGSDFFYGDAGAGTMILCDHIISH
jgi:hypothetical protein